MDQWLQLHSLLRGAGLAGRNNGNSWDLKNRAILVMELRFCAEAKSFQWLFACIGEFGTWRHSVSSVDVITRLNAAPLFSTHFLLHSR